MKNFPRKLLSLLMVTVMLLTILPFHAFGATVSGAAVVDYAMQFEGYPYVPAGKGPDSFDCSGFVYYVFKNFGISFPAGTDYYNTEEKAQAYGTVFYDMEQAEEGDLVIWSGHIAIYTGNGKCINALNPKHGVCVIDVEAYYNGVLNPPHFFLRPSFYENAQEDIYYHVTHDEYNATLTYDNGVLTATMIDPDLKEKYTINAPEIEVNHPDHLWWIDFTDGNNNFMVTTGHWKMDENDAEQTVSLNEMDSSWGFYTEEETSRILGEADLKIDDTKLIWTFKLLENANSYFDEFDAKNMKIMRVHISHYYDDLPNPEPETVLDKVVNFFKTIWNYIKKPFELLLDLFTKNNYKIISKQI